MGKTIKIIDTTLRDAHQCLWATRMRTAHMLPIAEKLARSGVAQVDLAGTIQFDVSCRYLKESMWERARLIRERMPNMPLRTIVRSRNLVTFDMVPDDIIELWVERLVANGFDVIGSFDGLNDVENMLVSLRVAKRLGVKTFGILSYGHSPVHTDDVYVRTARALVERAKVDTIMLKDAGGLLTVDRIRSIVPAVKKVIGDIPLEVHSHCLTGLAPLVYLEAVEAGADMLHTSIAPLANGPAQPATQTIVSDLRRMGYNVDIDDTLIDEIGEHFARIAEQEDKPVGQPAAYNAFHYEHQVPGGMMSNFRVQLEQVGLSDRFEELLRECARVRTELGYPIMITPFAQLVGTQAVLNVVHGERYKVVPDEVKKYALGYYGKLLAPVEPEALKRILKNGSAQIGATPKAPAPAVAALRAKYPDADDDERLLRFMFAGNQVDEMIAAGPAQTTYEFESPEIRLMRELSQRRDLSRVRISRGDFLLDMSYGA